MGRNFGARLMKPEGCLQMNVISVDGLADLTVKKALGQALKGVSFSIRQGEFVAVVGASGQAKARFFTCWAGWISEQADMFTSMEKICTGSKKKKRAVFRRRKIGFIFQSYNLILVLNVEEISNCRLLSITAARQTYINDLIHTSLDERRKHLPSSCRATTARVAIGRAVAYRPAIVLADETDRESG